jgi:hypothetical protein
MRFLLIGGLLALAVSSMPPSGVAFANTLTFGTSGPYGFVAGSYNESGFTYSIYSGGLHINNLGNPGNDMEAEWQYGGGVLRILSATPNTDFKYVGLDFAAYTALGINSETITVTGIDAGGNVVGNDSYTLPNTSVAYPSFSNWTAESAVTLAGQNLRELRITIGGGLWGGSSYLSAIDNVVLDPVGMDAPVPEPASLLTITVGLMALSAARRKRLRLSKHP